MADLIATYDPNLSTDADLMRFKVGDSVVGLDASGTEQALRPDAEYLALLALHGDWRLAAADMAESLASQYAQEPDSFSASGDMSVSWKERVKQWQWLAQTLRSEVAAEVAATSGIISVGTTRFDAVKWQQEYRDPFARYSSRRFPRS